MKDQLGDKLKNFEDVYRLSLPHKMPVIIRIDGCHFSQYTKKCKRPFDDLIIKYMDETCIHLCKNIQGAKVAYTQSDEISIFINSYENENSDAWFHNNIQKIASVSASMASAYFSMQSHHIFGEPKIAYFDSRVFILPKEEVNNVFVWRQKDAERNSIQMLARSLYSHKELHGKKTNELKELCLKKNVSWDNLATKYKLGRCCIKKTKTIPAINFKTKEEELVERSFWEIDNDIPYFHKDKEYIGRFI